MSISHQDNGKQKLRLIESPSSASSVPQLQHQFKSTKSEQFVHNRSNANNVQTSNLDQKFEAHGAKYSAASQSLTRQSLPPCVKEDNDDVFFNSSLSHPGSFIGGAPYNTTSSALTDSSICSSPLNLRSGSGGVNLNNCRSLSKALLKSRSQIGDSEASRQSRERFQNGIVMDRVRASSSDPNRTSTVAQPLHRLTSPIEGSWSLGVSEASGTDFNFAPEMRTLEAERLDSITQCTSDVTQENNPNVQLYASVGTCRSLTLNDQMRHPAGSVSSVRSRNASNTVDPQGLYNNKGLEQRGSNSCLQLRTLMRQVSSNGITSESVRDNNALSHGLCENMYEYFISRCSEEKPLNSSDEAQLNETTHSLADDHPDRFMNDLIARRSESGTNPSNKTAVIETTVWYPNGGQEDERQQLEPPYGLIIRQVRNRQMEKWQDLESLPIENKTILDDEDVVFEMERVRLAAQNDMQELLDIASELWDKTFQKANDLDRLHVENEELELQVRQYETNIRSLEEKLTANARLWQNKFKSALDELDETEQKLLATKQVQHTHHDDSEIKDELTSGNMYEVYLENLRLIRTLKTDKANLKRSLAEATAQLEVLTENIQDLEDINTKHQALQSRYSALSNQLAQTEKANYIQFEALEEAEERILALETMLAECEKDLEETKRHLNDQREMPLEDEDLNQTMGVCLMNELLHQNKNNEPSQHVEHSPSISEDSERKELTRARVTSVIITHDVEVNKENLSAENNDFVKLNLRPKETFGTFHTENSVSKKVKELVHAVEETAGEIKRIDVEKIDNKVHIHLHQHTHNHNHNHLHNHDHYHSYGEKVKSVEDTKETISPQSAAKSGLSEQSPIKKPIIWSRIHLGLDNEGNTKSFEHQPNAVGSTRLRPLGWHPKISSSSEHKKIPTFVDEKSTNVGKSGASTCATYASTKVKARYTQTTSHEEESEKSKHDSSFGYSNKSSDVVKSRDDNFALQFMEQVQKLNLTQK